MIKRIHINQHKIRSNKKNNIEEPVITVKTSKSNNYAKEVEILGKSKLLYKPNNPLSCGAKVWIETNEKVVLDNGLLILE
jgi:ribosomal protein L1